MYNVNQADKPKQKPIKKYKPRSDTAMATSVMSYEVELDDIFKDIDELLQKL
jgi:hypothetical protein